MVVNLKRFLPIVVLAVFLVGLATTLLFLPARTSWQNKATGGNVLSLATASVVLSFSAPAAVSPASTLDLTVTATPPNDGSLKVTSAKVTLTYPPILTVVSVTPGPFFTKNYSATNMKMLSLVDTSTAGKIIINYGAPCTTASPWQCYPTSSAAILATIRFQTPNSASTATFAFDNANSLVTAIDSSNNPISTSVLDTAQLTSVTTTIGTPNTYPTSGLVSRWKMDELSGQAVVDTLGVNNGTTTGTTIADGKSGKARNFSSGSDYVRFNASVGNFGTGDFSISYWVKTGKDSEYILSKRAVCGHDSFFNTHVYQGRIVLEVDQNTSGTNWAYVWGDRVINDNNWHNVVVSRKGTTLSAYIDGTLDKSATTVGVANINNNTTLQTSANPCSLPYVGTVDDLAVWNRALSIQEITSLYQSF